MTTTTTQTKGTKMAELISWIVPSNHPTLAGQVFHGGQPIEIRGERLVDFGNRTINGKRQRLAARIADKPELAAEVARYDAEVAAEAERGRLFRERDRLISAYCSACGLEADRRELAWERGDEAATFQGGNENEASITAAREAVLAFDAVHPEVKAAIDATRQADADRFLQEGN